MSDIPDHDDQEGAETLDETNLTPDGEDIANFDSLPSLFDATAAEDDADEDEPLDDPVDDEDLAAIDIDEEEEEDSSPRTLEDRPEDSPGSVGARRDADRVSNEDRIDPSRFESRYLSDDQLRELGYKD